MLAGRTMTIKKRLQISEKITPCLVYSQSIYFKIKRSTKGYLRHTRILKKPDYFIFLSTLRVIKADKMD